MYSVRRRPDRDRVTVAEVWAGRTIREAIRRSSDSSGISSTSTPGRSTARLAGEWRARARESGRSLDTPDALIAATAFDLEAIVLTRNVRDFELTPVRVETY